MNSQTTVTADDNGVADDQRPAQPETPALETQSAKQSAGTKQSGSTKQSTADTHEAYRKSDGSYDIDRIFKELTEERDRATGLRKKLGEQPSSKREPYSFQDIYGEDGSQTQSEPIKDDERAMLEDVVKSFNDIGLSKDQTKKLFDKFGQLSKDDTATEAERRAFYESEMAKLGDDKNTVLASLRTFSDAMVANKVWDGAKKQAFYDLITTADGARLINDAIKNSNVLRAGNFSNATPSQPQEFSDEEQVDAYRKAFILRNSNPIDGESALKKLDRMFNIK
jgi:hypothetical protein